MLLSLFKGDGLTRAVAKPGRTVEGRVPAKSVDCIQGAKAHRERPIALAVFLHGIAVHELTHLNARSWHSNGHDERFIAHREALGGSTGHLLPVIAQLAVQLLKLPVKEEPWKDKVGRLEGQVVVGQAALKEARATGERLAVRVRAEERLDRIHGRVRAGALEAGLDPDAVDAFVCRRRPDLLKLVQRAGR